LSPSVVSFVAATPTTELYTLSLHDALPISRVEREAAAGYLCAARQVEQSELLGDLPVRPGRRRPCLLATLAHHPVRLLAAGRNRSEEHTSELQSRENLVCRLLLEKKKTQ